MIKRYVAVTLPFVAALIFAGQAWADTITYTICDKTLRGTATDPSWGSHGTDKDLKRIWDQLERIYVTNIVSSRLVTYQQWSPHQIGMNYRFYPAGGTDANGLWFGSQFMCWWGLSTSPNTVTQAHTGRTYRDR